MDASERQALRHAIDRETRELIQDSVGPRRPSGSDPLSPPVPGDWMPQGHVPSGLRHVVLRRR